jgi:hypothetical protein
MIGKASKVMTPFKAAETFLQLKKSDKATGSSEAARFARAYENEAPDGDFSVYLELLEAWGAVACETETA